MANQGGVDELFDIKNAFYTGNYQTCIKEAQKLQASDAYVATDRDVFLYRAYLALKKFGVVRDEIGSASSLALRPIKTLANYLQTPSSRVSIVTQLEEQLSSNNLDLNNTTLLIVAANIFYKENNFEAALRVLHQSDDLECSAIRLQALLAMNRVDLARKELKSMQERDDDATLTQLAQAWVNMAMGGDKIQDAYYIYQELIDKLGSTALLLNGQAAAFIGQGKFEEAEAALQEALDKDSGNADALINMIVLSQQTGKPTEVCNRYLSQLKDSDPEHHFISSYAQKSADFERMVKQYAIAAN